MTADSVEREILIEASPEIVWGVITEPEQIGRWFSDHAELDLRAGGQGTLTWKPGGRGGRREVEMTVPIQVVDAEPFRRFAFRWNHPQGARADASNSALVEFSLIEEADATRLRVLESGIELVTDGNHAKARYREDHGQGWERHLGELIEHLASTRPEVAS